LFLGTNMRFHILVGTLILALLICDGFASEKPRKHKKVRKIKKSVAEADLQENVSNTVDSSVESSPEAEVVPPEIDDQDVIDNRVPYIDPCVTVHCGAGRVCEIDEDDEPMCVCIPDCPIEVEPRRKVCSNHNETWESDCSVYQHRCWCDVGDDRCKGDRYKHVHIEYYGECRDMPDCTKDEMSDFPRRMRDWLFNIMRDLADRQELPERYIKLEKEAELNHTRRWANAAIWKWCDLDGHPHDRTVSRHELFPIRAPLMALEHCIAPFLDGCDADNNHRISLKEWVTCLELEEDVLEDKCEDLENAYATNI
ncbi:hypothetical protein AMK59_7611, partial [Oryctes borbonicus]